ncbi:unnamed protein product [Kuraishia capsulata CBS 1993]|uniref:Major facilitator superfamily (MFS) profile domain-containing protein n=1 Tax=Kuraishia capsulata CBS 1993 TaxID=1382522 RepID=W6MRJ8_9ASCO|nr:uncharacterized protein KUCA_T00003851001 [Kuraishia capsulata CBS 1993]CDK27872.1 unnamed protein product [Kuraishia capsulata CBS 1993]
MDLNSEVSPVGTRTAQLTSTTNLYDDDNYIPGTINIFHRDVGAGMEQTDLKIMNGIILNPQPSDSPNDPLNWSPLAKYWQLLMLGFITGFTAATSNDAGAGQDSLNEIYGISYDAMNTGAGVLFCGIGYATFFTAPITSLYGRRIIYFVCIVSGLIGAAWYGASKRTSDTIWSQLFVGISESCAEAQVQLGLSDVFFQHQLGSVLTVYIMATSVGTYLGPLIAGFIADNVGFRWIGWTTVIISGGLLIVMYFTLFETYFDRNAYMRQTLTGTAMAKTTTPVKKIDEKEAEEEQNNSSDNRNEVSEPIEPSSASQETVSYRKRIAMITPSSNLIGWGVKQYFQRMFGMLRVFWFPPVVLSGMIWGIQDALLTFYLTTEDDDYYDDPWNYSDAGVALMNVPCLIGAIIGCLYAGVFSDWFVIWMAKRNGGVQEAEYRLYFLFASAIIGPCGLLMFGIGTSKGYDWHMTYVGLGFIGFGWGCSGDIAMSYLMDAYPDMVLEGMVGVAVINNTLGMIFTFACSPWLDNVGTQNTYIAWAVIEFVISMMAAPMIYWGKDCRRWTKKWYLKFLELRDD